MKTIFRATAVVLFFSLNTNAQDIEKLLFELPDVIFEKVDSRYDTAIVYELKVKQPIDHKDLSKGSFYQKVFLTHMGFDRPNVIVTEGYSCIRNRNYELTTLLRANQVQVEHRFFGESIPSPLNYNYLNLEQATADLHKINQLLRNIYPEKWVSTGISKGGATTIFYRYFYPNDVDACVPYVAPINWEFEEQRIYSFLDTVGTPECRERIKLFQVRMLENRDEILPWLSFYSLGAKLDYSYLSFEEAFEFSVLEYPFSFWQWGHQCHEIASDTVALNVAVAHLLKVSDIGFFADESMTNYSAHYYQSATEMGYYGYETKDFEGLLEALPTDSNPHAAFVPDHMEFEFNGSLITEVSEWLKSDGNQFAYIYGALDTWSASAVPPSENVDANWFFMEGKYHASARIRNMTEDEKKQLISSLERWLSIEIESEK